MAAPTPSNWSNHRQYQPIEQTPDHEQASASPVSTNLEPAAHASVDQTPPSDMTPNDTPPEEPLIGGPPSLRQSVAGALPWRPKYLRRTVFISFALLFAIVLIVIEVLLVLSNENDGLATGYIGQQYLWTYGPTAFLTLVAAVWGRVEYQSKVMTPWINLSQHRKDPKRTLLQDYLDDIAPWSLIKAVRSKDYLVAATTATSFLIRALIVLSTGLITLSWTTVHSESYPMVLKDRFVNNGGRLSVVTGLPFYMMTGHAQNNLSYPDGLHEGYAFQSLHTDLPAGTHTRVITDGFQSALDCHPAQLNMTWAKPRDPHFADRYLGFTLASKNCKVQAFNTSAPPWLCESGGACTLVFSRFQKLRCDDAANISDESGDRILLIFGNLTWTLDHSRYEDGYGGPRPGYLFKLNRSTQMLCTPVFSLGKLEVVRNGTKTLSATPVGSWNNTLSAISPWSLLDAHEKSAQMSWSIGGAMNGYGGSSIGISDSVLDTDPFVRIAILTHDAPNVVASSLHNATFLHYIVEDYYRHFTAIVAKQFLMQPASINVTGSVAVNGNRVVVQSLAAQWMAGLAVACTFLTAVSIPLVPGRGILPCSPSTITGMVSLLQHSQDLLRRLRYTGLADKQVLGKLLGAAAFASGLSQGPVSEQLQFSVFNVGNKTTAEAQMVPTAKLRPTHPIILHPGTRLGLGAVLLGIIITLEALLRKSNQEDGLGDAADDTYLHYTWTAIPALVFGSLALAFSAMDFAIRALEPFAALKRTVTTQTLMSLGLLDMSLPRTITRELKNARFAAVSYTLAFLVASLFTTFSASLYQPVFVEAVGSASLRIRESFPVRDSPYSGGDVGRLQAASLILASNLSYPKFTYADLAFPTFSLTDVTMPGERSFNSSTIPIRAVIPALRLKFTCRSYSSSDMTLNLTLNDTDLVYKEQTTLGVWINGEFECASRNKTLDKSTYSSHYATETYDTTVFGVFRALLWKNLVTCSDYVYMWGKLAPKLDPPVQHIADMGCNSTWEAVDVNVSFVGTNLDFDPDRPPVPLDETARRSTGYSQQSFNSSIEYSGLVGFNSEPGLQLDDFFGLLTTSRWAIPANSFSDPLSDNNTREAIKLQNKIIQAQILAGRRTSANATNATVADPELGETDDQLAFKATMTEPQARYRVVQDPASTRILQGLLGTALLLLCLGWILMRGTATLAASATSIASVAALVAGGNLVELLPENAAWLSRDEIKEALGQNTRFWMGWSAEGGFESGDENQVVVPRFGIYASCEEGQTTEGQGAGQVAEGPSH
ncbi:hypothetical protein OQA88_7239 [Cercophora sp. LCS_1]